MRKIATVFVVAVLVPTLVLAWLAMRSLRDQEIVANSQRAVLHQGTTDALGADLNTFMDDVRVFFRQMVSDLVEENGVEELSTRFDKIAPELWQQCSAACVVTDQGEILCPIPSTADPRAQSFLKLNAPFLLNQSDTRFYEAAPVNDVGPIISATQKMPAPAAAPAEAAASRGASSSLSKAKMASKDKAAKEDDFMQFKVEVAEKKMRSYKPVRRKLDADKAEGQMNQSAEIVDSFTVQGQKQAESLEYRNVQPSQTIFSLPGVESRDLTDNRSRLEWGIGNLSDIVVGKTEGALSRFLQDGLHVLLWNRHPTVADRIFWVELDLDEIKSEIAKILTGYSSNTDICLALLDAEGVVVAKTKPEFRTDWSRPFVASEVGQILPHWEVAAYLLDPDAVNQSARTARLLIWLLVPILLAAISIGTLLIFRSIGMEMQLARQKTDFVSNVSHELKTPLTSIRMFSELLSAEAKDEKNRDYSGIISREAARLTRLINNLLDFSRLEREDKPYSNDPIDLVDLTRETVETYRMQLEAEGCHLNYEPDPGISAQVRGDRDALSQVLLNLLSNAEKYGCPEGEIEVELQVDHKEGIAEWRVMDRGEGIERKHAAKIFEKFYRVNDSLSNGIQGSGLGLALAKQIVNHHGGQIAFQNRSGGGSVFLVRLPVTR